MGDYFNMTIIRIPYEKATGFDRKYEFFVFFFCGSLEDDMFVPINHLKITIKINHSCR